MRYKLREEFFGGLIYDSKNKKYIYVDDLVLEMISNPISQTTESGLEELISTYNVDRNEINEIAQGLNDLQLYDQNIDKVGVGKNKTSLSAPLRIFYDITYACNLRCRHCFTNSGVKREDELIPEERKKLIDMMAEMAIFRLSIAGGEPLILPDFFDFIEYARKHEIDISFTTNGINITQKVIDRLNDLDIKTITISLDGGRASSHDYIRGQGQFSRIQSSLALLKDRYEGRVALKTTLMKTNYREIDQIIQLGERYNCSAVKFNCIREDGRTKDNRNLLLTQDDYIEVIKYAANLKSESIKIKLPLNIYEQCEYNYMEELGFGCFAGKESICINPVGEVKPCSHMPEKFIAGNILRDHLQDIWKNSWVINKFQNFDGNPVCNNCEQYDFCRAGCRYRAFLAGDINGIDPYCYLRKNEKNLFKNV